MRRTMVGVLAILTVAAFATGAGAQQRLVFEFTSISVTPQVDQGPPLSVDLAMDVQTIFSSSYQSSNGEQITAVAQVYTPGGSTVDYSVQYVSRNAAGDFQTTFSFPLPGDGVYNYWVRAYYYWSPSLAFTTTATGTFNTVSRAGIPALGSLGLLLLGAALAATGVFLLRRS